MRIGILGATGGIGRWLLRIARENGDHVKILARDPRALPADLGAIGVVRGDAYDPAAVAAVVGGSDVVLSALGPRSLGPETVCSRGVGNVLSAMHENSLVRVLVVSSAGVEDDPGLSFLMRRFVGPVMLRNPLADLRDMERELTASGLAYTIVRPTRLDVGPRTGAYRTNERFLPPNPKTVSRADVADFMIRAIVDERTIGKTIAIAR